ncbi:DHA2 family efflux MFS transporter permease subunit [Paeniglutamicibacter gangotriensis]|uniref:DHA2 family efflux MFS transporter permease subunit n=1 Tax=Paeniglutamicibacter gangotriensis TaxID=254787 RepID=UPI00034AABC7|nr:DHA2 family efflux MFS transporter permease subunit [Paeniglutamicibacter gangotriensis]
MTAQTEDKRAWGALWALVIGFFMILVDSTIVSTAMPAIMHGLDTDINGVIWVNSAYLLAFAVPLLITGRLGDRFGPRTIYLIGLVIFTLSSLWCGLAPDVTTLIIARVVQGLGASLMSPQTMTFITRMFPYARRGAAMGVWGAVAGIATLVGPIAGGVFVDTLGWEWIFFVNVPIGILAIWRVLLKVPELERHSHSFDWLGVFLSAAAMFALVFGIQEGNGHDWKPFIGPIGSWHLIIGGVLLLGAFIWWQAATRAEPLVPLRLFKDKNFSLANIAIAFMGLSITAMSFPMILYLQSVRGLTPTLSALMLAPMAIVAGVLAPVIGKNVGKIEAKYFAVPGFFLFGASITVYGLILRADTPFWVLLIPPVFMGLGSAMIWPSVSLTATRDLGQADAGAGSGVYNTTRQVGAVLGSALIALMMESRIAVESEKVMASMSSSAAAASAGAGASNGEPVPEFLHQAFSLGLGQSLLLPGIVAMAAALLALMFRQGARKSQ